MAILKMYLLSFRIKTEKPTVPAAKRRGGQLINIFLVYLSSKVPVSDADSLWVRENNVLGPYSRSLLKIRIPTSVHFCGPGMFYSGPAFSKSF